MITKTSTGIAVTVEPMLTDDRLPRVRLSLVHPTMGDVIAVARCWDTKKGMSGVVADIVVGGKRTEACFTIPRAVFETAQKEAQQMATVQCEADRLACPAGAVACHVLSHYTGDDSVTSYRFQTCSQNGGHQFSADQTDIAGRCGQWHYVRPTPALARKMAIREERDTTRAARIAELTPVAAATGVPQVLSEITVSDPRPGEESDFSVRTEYVHGDGSVTVMMSPCG